MDETLIEAARNNDTTDLEANLVNLSRDVLDQLQELALEHNSRDFAQLVIRANEILASTENQVQEPGFADYDHTDPIDATENQVQEVGLADDDHTDPIDANDNTDHMIRMPLDNTRNGTDSTDQNRMMRRDIEIALEGALVAFFTALTIALFAAFCTFKDKLVESEQLKLGFEDLMHPNKWPSEFWKILMTTVAFTVCLTGAVCSLWSIIRNMSCWHKAYMYSTVGTFILIYAILLWKKVPKFSFGTFPSFWVVVCACVVVNLLLTLLTKIWDALCCANCQPEGTAA